jgi:hypothetical protein
LVGEKSIQFALFPGPKQPVEISTRGNIFDDAQHCVLLGVLTLKKVDAPTPGELIEMLRLLAKWSEEGNVHQRGAQYIVARRLSGFVSAEVGSVAGWLKLWNLPPAQSVEGDIHFHKRDGTSGAEPPRLDRVDNPSGPVPAKVGADPERVGPGQSALSN